MGGFGDRGGGRLNFVIYARCFLMQFIVGYQSLPGCIAVMNPGRDWLAISI